MSKIFVFYYLIHVLMSIALIGQSSALLKFLCLRPPFATITPIAVNKSYFVTDHWGRYWNSIKEDTYYKNYEEMRGSKNGYIGDILTKDQGKPQFGNQTIRTQMNDHSFSHFDVTFRINFERDCRNSPEQLFGIRLLKSKTTVYTYFKDGEWSDIKNFTSKDIRITGHEMLQQIINKLNTTKVIKAVLDFKMNGFLFIQDQQMYYVYCSKEKGWNLYNKEVETNLIVFEKKHKINLGQIFGGYANDINDTQGQLYLFGGQITSVGYFVRKYVHKCDYNIEKSGTPPQKIRLFCEKLFFRDVCDKSETKLDLETKIAVYSLIGAVSVLVFLVIVLVVMVILKPRRKKFPSLTPPTDPSSGSTKTKPNLALNRERVIGDKPKPNTPKPDMPKPDLPKPDTPKPDTPKGRGLSRKRTQAFRKK